MPTPVKARDRREDKGSDVMNIDSFSLTFGQSLLPDEDTE